MSIDYLENTRSGCALQGALATVQSIPGVAPVVHSTAGCGVQYQNGIVPYGGLVPVTAVEGPALSSTNIAQKHVIFGGGSRLREQLKNTVKILNADLYFVLTGCATEMVGDDIRAMSKEGTDQGFPVAYANTPGFSGAMERGYEQVTHSLLTQLPPALTPPERNPRQVNLWGIVPQHDPYWQGHLRQIGELLATIGVRVHPLLGQRASIANWQTVSSSALNLVFSDAGVDAAAWLSENHHQPWLRIDRLPIGEQATTEFLRQVAEALHLPAEPVATAISAVQAEYRDLLCSIRHHYYRYGFQREAALIGEAQTVLALQQYLSSSLGIYTRLAIITDAVDDEENETRKKTLQALTADGVAYAVYEQDAGVIADLIDEHRVELIVGSSLEQAIAGKLRIPLLAVSFPVADRLILRKGFIGVEGAATLLESLGDALLSNAPA